MKTMDNNNNFTTKISNVHQMPNDRQILILKEYPKNFFFRFICTENKI